MMRTFRAVVRFGQANEGLGWLLVGFVGVALAVLITSFHLWVVLGIAVALYLYSVLVRVVYQDWKVRRQMWRAFAEFERAFAPEEEDK